jgi:hypothetical protein
MQFIFDVVTPDRRVFREKLGLTPESPPKTFTLSDSDVEILSIESREDFESETGAFSKVNIRFYTKTQSPRHALAIASWVTELLDHQNAVVRINNSPWLHDADEIRDWFVRHVVYFDKTR